MDIDKVYPDEVIRDYDALLPETMRRVDEALRVALPCNQEHRCCSRD